jgi:phytanoyl-CoA hydroxylase
MVDEVTPENGPLEVEKGSHRGPIHSLWHDGVFTGAVTPEELAALRRDFDGWVEESRSHDGPYGEAMDGRPRFDVQPGHTAAKPALRRVQAPTEVSGAYYQAMADSRMADMVADLIGPDVKLHHTKINSKLPGSATEVKWHQDFPFTPPADGRRGDAGERPAGS